MDFLVEYDKRLNRNYGWLSTLTALHLPFGFLPPDFFGATCNAFSAANG